VRKVVAQTTKQGWVYTFDRATGEPIWPMVETPVPQSEVPGEKTSPTQPIPAKPEPFAHMGLEEEDLIDYTPEIKARALGLARLCRMGPYYIPASPIDGTAKSGYRCSWYAPGAAGGVNIDGGAAVDPETGFLYVASQSGLSTIEVGKDPCSEHDYTQASGTGPRDSCGQIGAPPPPPGYVAPARGGRGAGAGRAGAAGGRGAAAASEGPPAPGTSTIAGISILKPRELGGIMAYNMNTGDKAWWIANGGTYIPTVQANSPDAKLFEGVKLLPQGSRGQAQVITTKTLMIYGTGRSGGPPGADPALFAVDKATGRQIGALPIPTKTSAVPMTFMHKGRQYIVYATGGGTAASLVAWRLPR